MRIARTAFLLGALLPVTPALSGQEAEQLGLIQEHLLSELSSIAERYEGVAGLHVLDLSSGDRFAVRDELIFPQASAIKIPILLELFRRAESDPGLLSKRIEMTEEVRTGGSGVLGVLTDGGSALSLEDYAIYMILHTDNTATNVLIDELGMGAINALSASLGAPNTLLQRKMIQPEESARGNENLSTPRDAAEIMQRIANCELPMSEMACARVIEILSIPKGGPIRRPVPNAIPIAFKPGGITGVATVWAIVNVPDRPYVITVMSNYGGDGGAVIEAAQKADSGERFRTEAAMAKLVATEASSRVIDRCIQIHGGVGVTKDLPLERWYRELRIRRVGEGPSEVQRLIMARDILGGSFK